MHVWTLLEIDVRGPFISIVVIVSHFGVGIILMRVILTLDLPNL